MKTKFKKIAAFFFAVFMMMGIFSLEAFALEEGASEYSYLSKLSFSNDSKGEVPYAMSPKFDGKTFEYTVFVEDNYSAIRARATLSEEDTEG